MSVRRWWRAELRLHPERFAKRVLLRLTDGAISRRELKALEASIQGSENHKDDPRYFNRTNHVFGGDVNFYPFKGRRFEDVMGVERAAARRRAISEWTRGRIMSAASRLKLSRSKLGLPAHNRGVAMSEQQTVKLSLARMGMEPWNKGKSGVYSESTIVAIKAGRAAQNMGMWITDGSANRKVYDGVIPDGFRKGRCAPHLQRTGASHSQYGTRWATDGSVSKKVAANENLPEGWRYGRHSRSKGEVA